MIYVICLHRAQVEAAGPLDAADKDNSDIVRDRSPSPSPGKSRKGDKKGGADSGGGASDKKDKKSKLAASSSGRSKGKISPVNLAAEPPDG